MECGCFSCLQIVPATEVIDWIDDGETPVCPLCGLATLLPGETDLNRLLEVRHRRFGARLG